MTAVNCPMCELRFVTRTERDWHLRNEHRHPDRAHPSAPESAAGGRERAAGAPTPQPPPKG